MRPDIIDVFSSLQKSYRFKCEISEKSIDFLRIRVSLKYAKSTRWILLHLNSHKLLSRLNQLQNNIAVKNITKFLLFFLKLRT